jgi:hypothetical protein
VNPGRRIVAFGVALAPWCLAGPAAPASPAPPCCGVPDAQARALRSLLDHSGVERLWLPHTTEDWLSGQPRPTARGLRPLASHCSAFVASIASRLGVELPHPPRYPQRLLANTQARWLASAAARDAGWRPAGLLQAQTLANRGWLVLAAFVSPDARRPGHIAVVRPSLIDQARLWESGPWITQAGTRNWLRISTARGFAQHPGAWKPGASGGLRLYAHAVDARRIGTGATPRGRTGL